MILKNTKINNNKITSLPNILPKNVASCQCTGVQGPVLDQGLHSSKTQANCLLLYFVNQIFNLLINII